MTEIIFLGTGGSVASKERDNNSFLLKTGDMTFLVECPGSVIQKVKKTGIDPLEIEAVFITHIHTDHVYGLPSLVHSLMLEERRVRLFGSEGTVEFCRRLLSLFDLLKDKVKYRLDFVPLSDGEDVYLSPALGLRAFHVPHSPESLAFQFSLDGGRLRVLYSGDTPVHPPLFEHAQGVEYLIHDCSAPSRIFKEYPFLKTMHTPSSDLGTLAQKAGVQCLIPCHLFGEVDFSDEEILGEILHSFKGRVIVPEDFLRIELD